MMTSDSPTDATRSDPSFLRRRIQGDKHAIIITVYAELYSA